MHSILRPAAVLAIFAAMTAGATVQDESQKSAAEARAVGYIHTVVAAQREYRKKHNQYARTLATLVGSGSFTRRMANPDRGDYKVGFSGGGAGYALTLTPTVFNAEHRAFFVNESGAIRVEPDKPASSQSPRLQE